MALTVSTFSVHVTAPVNNVLMRGLLSAARRTFPYFNGTLPGALTENGGSKTVKWRRIENLSAATTALGEVDTAAFGMGRTPTTPVITDLTVAVDKYGNFMYVSEELDLFNVNSRAAQLLDNLGENAGHSLNVLMRDIFDGVTKNVRFGGGAATISDANSEIVAADIRAAVNTLNRNSAMKFFPQGTGSTNIDSKTIRSSYYGVCHPDVEEDIRDISGFVGVEQYGGYTATIVGEFGAVNGVRFSTSEIAPLSLAAEVNTTSALLRGTATGAQDLYSTFIYGREAVGSVGLGADHTDDIYMGGDSVPSVEVIQKGLGSAGTGDPFNETASVAWKAWWAGKVLNPDWVVKLVNGATTL